MSDELTLKIALLEQQREHDKQVADDNHAQIMECLKSNKETMSKMGDTLSELGEFRHEVMGISDRLVDLQTKQDTDAGRIKDLEDHNLENKGFIDTANTIKKYSIIFLCTAIFVGGFSTFYGSKNKTDSTSKIEQALKEQTEVLKTLKGK